MKLIWLKLDKMEWPFILLALKNFISWISTCLSIVSFSILLNGSPYGDFSSTKGFRQGDPLSPFLFIIGTKLPSRLLLLEESRTNLKGLKLGIYGPRFSHLLLGVELHVLSLCTLGFSTSRKIWCQTYLLGTHGKTRFLLDLERPHKFSSSSMAGCLHTNS